MHISLYYFVTAHPDDGQARPKHVGATNWKSIYHLWTLLVLISNYTTMRGVQHVKLIINSEKSYRYVCLNVLLLEA